MRAHAVRDKPAGFFSRQDHPHAARTGDGTNEHTQVIVIIFALTYIPLEVGKLVDAINARPKYRAGFPRSLVGKQLHVVLAMSGGGGATSGGGGAGGVGVGVGGGGAGAADGEFDCDMLERCVAEFFDDVRSSFLF